MPVQRKDAYALMNAVMAQLTGQDTFQVIDAQGFLDAGKLAMTYSTEEIYNALSIVGARLFTATRPYKAPLWLIDSINSGYFNNRLRKVSNCCIKFHIEASSFKIDFYNAILPSVLNCI